ncbi:hypothetical protein LTR84_005224 [Exophiala bonariae]|uniref:Uncharacterized protein n=1 Tax=Exophiala bonariae TaxID=1690606 RepID=A0AAV9NQ37_9EURO|nr:hypothetical protein LTR84_005224 [Exophiala bonariae]
MSGVLISLPFPSAFSTQTVLKTADDNDQAKNEEEVDTVMNGVGAAAGPQNVAVDKNSEPAQSASKSPSHTPSNTNPTEPTSEPAAVGSPEDRIMDKVATIDTAGNENGVAAAAAAAAAEADGDSEAETLIQSPEKQRTNADTTSVAGSQHTERERAKEDDSPSRATATDSDNRSRKRKRSLIDHKDDENSLSSSRHSSPLSSPRAPTHSPDSDSDLSSRIELHHPRSGLQRRPSDPAADSDDAEDKSVQIQTRRRRPSDLLPPISKHRNKTHNSGPDPGSSERRETRSATYPRHSSNERSPSPRPPVRREHRRGVSTQLTLGDVERKKRGRPPAINTKRSGSADRVPSPSDSDSDSPQTRPPLNKLSSADHDAMSPAKASGPRKIRDKNGRTALSRACNANDLASAQAKFAERPQDLNLADNAGNTPLQIASLMGFEDIVKFLLESNADVDTRNIDKETPLIDAVENGHLEVVRLLLQHGANPRLGNAKGDEPYELVPLDDPNHAELRRLLADARENNTNRRKSSDQVEIAQDRNSSRAASAASPRDSPPINGPRSPPNPTQRRRTGRSESTRNDLLWQANTQENLTRLAAKGDVQGVANILNILQKAETESLIAAAKAGHEEVLQYLLGMGDPETDPDPLRHLKAGYNTPVLAAIGRGHPEVVKLLVEQSGFDPTKRILKGKSYYEIASERKGEQWQKEVDILKSAYDKHATGRSRKGASPRMTRDSDKQKSRPVRRSQSPISSKLRNSTSSSPTLTHKSLPNKSPQSSQKGRDRESGSTDGGNRRKHLPARREIGDPAVAVSSDQDQTVAAPRKSHVKRRSQSDLPQASQLDLDSAHRRRRLVSGKEHRRRKSIVEEEASGEDDSIIAVKTEARSSTILKRQRESFSPPADVAEEEGTGRSITKKRRTVVESSPEESRPGPKKRNNQSLSSSVEQNSEHIPSEDERPKRRKLSKNDQNVPLSDKSRDEMLVDKPEETSQADNGHDVSKESNDKHAKPLAEEVEVPVKSEPVDTGPTEAELELKREEEERKAAEARRAEEDRLAAEKAAEEQRIAEEKERIKKAEEEAERKRKEEEERQERIRRELEERQRRQEEQLRLARLEIERRRREALPALLCRTAFLIDNEPSTSKSVPWLSRFLPLFTAKLSQLDNESSVVEHDSLWVPNFQVAGLLATKDLNLRNYTSLDKRPVTPAQRQSLWRVSRNMLSYDYDTNSLNTTIKQANQKEEEERPKFFAMEELFWVKLSDFNDQLFRHPHLNSLSLKKQAISLRTIGSYTPTAHSPQTNGFPSSSPPKLTNGVNPLVPPTLYSNGYTRL